MTHFVFHSLKFPVRWMHGLLRPLLPDSDAEALAVFLLCALGLIAVWQAARCWDLGLQPALRWMTGFSAAARFAGPAAAAVVLAALVQPSWFGQGITRGKEFEIEKKKITADEGWKASSTLAKSAKNEWEKRKDRKDLLRIELLENGSASQMRRIASSAAVAREGRGAWALSDRKLWLSASDGTSPASNSHRYSLRLVISVMSPDALAFWIRGAAIFVFLALAGLAVASAPFRSFIPRMGRSAADAWRARDAVLPRGLGQWLPGIAVAAGFLVLHSMHLARFAAQEPRMQYITTRPDDGVLMEKLNRIPKLDTLDPQIHENYAYGASAFIAAGWPVFAAHQFGIAPSPEMVTLLSRSITGLYCALSLLAVHALGWMLGGPRAGGTAALLAGTALSFLMFSTYPFYPDVWMAGCSAMGLVYGIGCIRAFSMRRVFLAMLWCGIGAGLKFLSWIAAAYLLAVFAAAFIARSRGGSWMGKAGGLAVIAGIAAGTLTLTLVASNPYFDYFLNWIVPRYGELGSGYGAESEWAGVYGAARLQDWWLLLIGVRQTDWVLWVLLASLGIAAIVRAARGRDKSAASYAWMSGEMLAALAILAAAVFYLAVEWRTITIASALCGRLVFFPLWCVFAVFGWLCWRVFEPAAGAGASVASRIRGWAPLVLIAAVLAPRMSGLADWQKRWGRAEFWHDTKSWLDATGFPATAPINGSPHVYVPGKFNETLFCCWHVGPDYLARNQLPALWIEDVRENDRILEWPAERVKADPLVSRIHWQYAAQRAGRFFPFIEAGTGRDTQGRNRSEPMDQAPIETRRFVDRYLWSANLLGQPGARIEAASGFFADDQPGHLDKLTRDPRWLPASERSYHWIDLSDEALKSRGPATVTIALPKPARLDMFRFQWANPANVPSEFTVEGRLAGGSWMPLVAETGWENKLGAMSAFFQSRGDQPVEAVRLTFQRSKTKAVYLQSFAAFPAAPMSCNPAAHWFSWTAQAQDWRPERPASHAFAELFDAGRFAESADGKKPVALALEAKGEMTAEQVILAFASEDAAPERIRIAVKHKDSPQEERLFTSSDLVREGAVLPHLIVRLPDDRPLSGMTITLEPPASGGPVKLAQLSALCHRIVPGLAVKEAGPVRFRDR